MSNRQLINAFKALSDDTRLRVLCLLSRRECCVCEVAQALEIPQPRASRCLTALYNAGLLKLRKDGAMSLYSIDRSGLGGLSSKLVDAVVDSLKSSETVTGLAWNSRAAHAFVNRMKKESSSTKLFLDRMPSSSSSAVSRSMESVCSRTTVSAPRVFNALTLSLK